MDHMYLLQTDDYTLSYLLNDQGLKLTLKYLNKANPNKILKTMQGYLPDLLSEEKLTEYFQNFGQLIEYMKLTDNIRLNNDKQITSIKIISKINTKKSKQLQLAQIVLTEKKKTLEDQLNNITIRCSQQQALNDTQIKQALLNLCQLISSKMYNKQQKNSNTQIKKQQVEVLMKQMSQNANKNFDNMYKQIQNQISQIKNSLLQTVKSLNVQARLLGVQKFISNYNNTQQTIKFIANQFNVSDTLNIINKKIEDLQESLKNTNIQAIPQMKKIQTASSVKQIGSVNWVDPQCFHFGRLSLGVDNITAEQAANIFGRRRLTDLQPSFTIKINTMKDYISLGVINSKYKKQSNLKNLANRITYCSDGDFFDGKAWKHKQGSCFLQKQSITVTVNLKTAQIQWKVGKNVRFKTQVEQLKDPSIVWVPYVYLCKQFDNISFSQ